MDSGILQLKYFLTQYFAAKRMFYQEIVVLHLSRLLFCWFNKFSAVISPPSGKTGF